MNMHIKATAAALQSAQHKHSIKWNRRERLRQNVEKEYKDYLTHVTTMSGADLWKYRNRLYFYSNIQEYIQHVEWIPGTILNYLVSLPVPLKMLWNYYLKTEEVSAYTWWGIEDMVLAMMLEATKKQTERR